MGNFIIFMIRVSYMIWQIPEISGYLAMGGCFFQTAAVNLDQLLLNICNFSLNACNFLHMDIF